MHIRIQHCDWLDHCKQYKSCGVAYNFLVFHYKIWFVIVEAEPVCTQLCWLFSCIIQCMDEVTQVGFSWWLFQLAINMLHCIFRYDDRWELVMSREAQLQICCRVDHLHLIVLSQMLNRKILWLSNATQMLAILVLSHKVMKYLKKLSLCYVWAKSYMFIFGYWILKHRTKC
jgi:hypothetical protein